LFKSVFFIGAKNTLKALYWLLRCPRNSSSWLFYFRWVWKRLHQYFKKRVV